MENECVVPAFVKFNSEPGRVYPSMDISGKAMRGVVNYCKGHAMQKWVSRILRGMFPGEEEVTLRRVLDKAPIWAITNLSQKFFVKKIFTLSFPDGDEQKYGRGKERFIFYDGELPDSPIRIQWSETGWELKQIIDSAKEVKYKRVPKTVKKEIWLRRKHITSFLFHKKFLGHSLAKAARRRADDIFFNSGGIFATEVKNNENTQISFSAAFQAVYIASAIRALTGNIENNKVYLIYNGYLSDLVRKQAVNFGKGWGVSVELVSFDSWAKIRDSKKFDYGHVRYYPNREKKRCEFEFGYNNGDSLSSGRYILVDILDGPKSGEVTNETVEEVFPLPRRAGQNLLSDYFMGETNV